MALSTTTKIGLGVVVAGAIGLLVALDPGEGLLEYAHVDEVMQNVDHYEGRTFKIYGKVVPGSIKAKKGATGDYHFVIENKGERLAVHFTNIPPDTFQDEAEVIMTGKLNAAGDTFESEEMSAKCPSKYEEQSEIKGAAEKPVTKT